MVIDADALTLLAETELKSPSRNWVLTPHPGEAARLLNCDTIDIQANRLSAAKQIARDRNCICVLKGAGTLIADQNGNVWLCDEGNPGMATAGMGDVLSGIIASLIAEEGDLLKATKAAVWLHAATADRLALIGCEKSLLASDIIDGLSHSIKSITQAK